MKVAIIGAGNVGSVLAGLIKKSNYELTHIASRTLQHAQALAEEMHTTFSLIDAIPKGVADIFILAVSDTAISDCAAAVKITDEILLHTAGSASKEILKSHAFHYGVLYPLQSLTKKMRATQIPLLVDGSSEEIKTTIKEFALALSSNVHIANDEERLKLHASAVIVSNFSNHLYALAEEFCKKEKVDFQLLQPLIAETADRLQYSSPSLVQTGPASRHDLGTIEKHLKLFNDFPKLRAFYKDFSDSIMQ
ncbi:MAG: DUF2520 domain-containing protein [Ferruginibacter sp.]